MKFIEEKWGLFHKIKETGAASRKGGEQSGMSLETYRKINAEIGQISADFERERFAKGSASDWILSLNFCAYLHPVRYY